MSIALESVCYVNLIRLARDWMTWVRVELLLLAWGLLAGHPDADRCESRPKA